MHPIVGMSLLKGEDMRRDEALDAWRRGKVRQDREAAAMYFDKAMECEEGGARQVHFLFLAEFREWSAFRCSSRVIR